jgi:hypothetical protein
MRAFAATLVVMTEGWTPAQLLEAVRSGVPSVSVHDDSNLLDAVRAGDGAVSTAYEVPMQFSLDGADLVATFRWPGEQHLFGVRFPTSDVPTGPSTGDVCESPDEWAQEVGLVLMEELDTGLVRRGRRALSPSGIVELDHWHNDPTYREQRASLPSLNDGQEYRVSIVPPESD